MSFPLTMVIYHSYVSLPEGIKGNVHSWHWYTKLLWSVLIAILGRFLLYHYWKLQSCTPWPWSLKPLASWCSHQNSVGKSMFTSQTIWFIEFRNIGWSQGFISPRTGLRENAQEHLSLLKKKQFNPLIGLFLVHISTFWWRSNKYGYPP